MESESSVESVSSEDEEVIPELDRLHEVKVIEVSVDSSKVEILEPLSPTIIDISSNSMVLMSQDEQEANLYH